MAGKKVKLETGTVYQKQENGTYYFRYQLNGQRKAVSLKTKNQKEAVKKAQEFVPDGMSKIPSQMTLNQPL